MAAVIVEPVAANMGVVAPAAGFLAGLRAECDRVGALLVFDEVITGFRLGPGGAQAKYDVTPDLTTFGKVIGGGLPIGAVGGRREVMETLSPLGPVFHSGTLSGNPLATAAGLAALGELTPDVYIELMARAGRLPRCSATPARPPASRPGSRSSARCSGMVCGDGPAPVDFDDARTHRRGGVRARSSTPCSTRAWPSRPGPTRRCSSGSATTTRCSTPSASGHHTPPSPPPSRSPSAPADRRRAPVPLSAPEGTSSVAPMRQVISWRFETAIGRTLLGLALFVNVAFADRGSIAEVVEPSAPPTPGAPEFVAIVLETNHEGFSMSETGYAQGDLTMSLVGDRTARVFPGTPGVVTCEDLDKPCALLAETLGDTIMWLTLVPMGPNFQFELPAIESLDGGWATLVNGWQVRLRVRDRPQSLRLAGRVVLGVPQARRAGPPGRLQPRQGCHHQRRVLIRHGGFHPPTGGRRSRLPESRVGPSDGVGRWLGGGSQCAPQGAEHIHEAEREGAR